MLVNSFYSNNFRNLNIDITDFSSHMNVICGENAQGKTNILEGLWLFTGAKSFRMGNENTFIKFGSDKGVIKSDFVFGGVKNSAKIEFGDKKTAYFNEKALSSPSKLAGKFNAVIFTPDDIGIVRDGPDKRRRFLDINIGQIFPQYIDVLRDYLRAVKQRNEIIKNLRYDSTSAILLDSFEEAIANCGEKIINYRKNYVETLNKSLLDIYNGLSGGRENIILSYFNKNEEKSLLELLKEARREDSFTGTTSIGPHRDDLSIKINGIDARTFGSQGQKRSVALYLKLSSAEVIKEKTGEYPICLLDDVMSELDETRQNYILNHISGRQSFITCCDPKSIERLQSGKIIEIKNGEVN